MQNIDNLQYKTGLWQSIKDGAKICKYEFLMTRVLLILTCVLAVLIALFPLAKDENTIVFAVLGSLIYLGNLLFVVSYFLSAAISFYHGIFGRNAYLTHSLPISLDAMIIGKILVFLLWTGVFGALQIFLDIASGTFLFLNFGYTMNYAYAIMGVVWCAFTLAQLTYIFMIATLVHSRRSYTIVWGIVYYFGISMLLLICFGMIIGMIPDEFWEVIVNNTGNTILSALCVIVLPLVALSLVFYFICRVIINRKLSI